jgi:hypothetical protein
MPAASETIQAHGGKNRSGFFQASIQAKSLSTDSGKNPVKSIPRDVDLRTARHRRLEASMKEHGDGEPSGRTCCREAPRPDTLFLGVSIARLVNRHRQKQAIGSHSFERIFPAAKHPGVLANHSGECFSSFRSLFCRRIEGLFREGRRLQNRPRRQRQLKTCLQPEFFDVIGRDRSVI